MLYTDVEVNAKHAENDIKPLNNPLLHQIFTHTAQKYSEAIAVTCQDGSLTYEELDKRSNQLAQYLVGVGCKPGSMVALYLSRSHRPYIAMLAVLKAGGAYIPLDPAFPNDRIDFILADAHADIVITEDSLAKGLTLRAPHVIKLDRDKDTLKHFATSALNKIEVHTHDPCYAIYTSGSTGKPKGVLIEHAAACNFVSAMLPTYGIQKTDVIYQGFSHAFDASVEEIWAAFGSGAKLVVGEQDVCKSSEAVTELIIEHGITVFSTVPTFLSAMTNDLPSVRLLIVGGERCPQELVNRWANGRIMLNTYGPTEATVVATVSQCQAGQNVTIGKAMPGYKTYILDESNNAVSAGSEGELCIAGPILARGYINLPEQTRKVFTPNPFSNNANDQRLYRTGDLAKLDGNSNIEFMGRIDSQIKIRGYRVELSEIETVIAENEAIQTAAVKVVDIDNVQYIAAYIVLNNGLRISDFNHAAVRQSIADRLPKYMMPTYFDILDAMPVLASGKTNLKSLPHPVTRFTNDNREILRPSNNTEVLLSKLCQALFNIEEVSIEDDFFDDLGGHSLLAAKYAGTIRYELGYECMSIRDVFAFPTIKALAIELMTRVRCDNDDHKKTGPSEAELNYKKLSLITQCAVPALQALSIFVIYALFSGVFSYVFQLVQAFLLGEVSTTHLITSASLLLIGSYPAMLALAICAKWLLIGRYEAGEYPVWGGYYLRWWLATRLQQVSGSHILSGSPFMVLFYKLMGAKIGKRVYLDTSATMAFDMLTIGDDCSIGADTHILGYRVEDGLLKIAPIHIGDQCFVGIHSNIGLNTRLNNHCRIEDFTQLDDNVTVKEGASLAGSPAQCTPVTVPQDDLSESNKNVKQKSPNSFNPQSLKSFTLSLIAIYCFFVIGFVFMAAITMAAIWIYLQYGLIGTFWSILLGAPLSLLLFSLLVVAIKHSVVPRSKAGTYGVASGFYYRKWFLDLFIKTHRALFIPMYATLYLPTFLRLLGAKIGKGVEVSTIAHISPELMEAGEGCFYADAAIIGGKRVFGGYFQIDICKIGNRTFIGNSAMLPIGTNIGDECLIGCLSTPPADHHIDHKPIAQHDQKWLGSPPIKLSNTQSFSGFDDKYLYSPTTSLYVQRYIIDTIRILLPTYITSAAYLAACFIVWGLAAQLDGFAFYFVLPIALFGVVLVTLGCVLTLKNIIVGAFKPIVKPLWSSYVWFNEVVNALYEAIYTPCISLFCGTPFVGYFMRAIGARIGKRVYLDSLLFSEFDLAEIGDYAALNVGCTIQTHLFEDRIMKSSYLKIDNGASIGNMSVVLYDSHIGEGTKVAPLSLVMKGESLPNHSHWQGIPVHKVVTPAPSKKLNPCI